MGKRSTNKRSSKGSGFRLFVICLILMVVSFFLGQYAVKWYGQQSANKRSEQSKQLVVEQQTPSSSKAQQSKSVDLNQERNSSTVQNQSQSLNQEIKFQVQLGAFSVLENALTVREQLEAKGYDATVTDGPPFRVRSGGFATREAAQEYANKLEKEGFEVAIVAL